MSARKVKDYPAISLLIESFSGVADFSSVFGRSGAVHIEIGCGKGTFLVSQAKALPNVNFLGIEWANKYYRHAVDRIGRWGLSNVRIMRTDAAAFLAEHVADESVECFHIYFPDPWPKKRHNKRRLFVQTNLDQMIRSLNTGGTIQVATDFAEYFEQIEELFSANRARLEPMEFIRPAGALDGELVGTNYERKYLKEDRGVHALAVRKISPANLPEH